MARVRTEWNRDHGPATRSPPHHPENAHFVVCVLVRIVDKGDLPTGLQAFFLDDACERSEVQIRDVPARLPRSAGSGELRNIRAARSGE